MTKDIQFQNSAAFAEQMDAKDPLKNFRSKFNIPKKDDGSDKIYFVGNSLGCQPKKAREYVEEELNIWARVGKDGYFLKDNYNWIDYLDLLGEQMAPVVGAKPVEVAVMNTLTTNLHFMMVSFYRPTSNRYKIIIEKGAFPSDVYAVKSQIAFHGYDVEDALLELSPLEGEETLREEDIEAFIEKEGDVVALILLGGVNYYTGQAFDIEKITGLAHRKGCTVGFDLAHAAGNLVLKLHDWNVDFAIWCNYKYINGGPGAAGAIFVHEKYADAQKLPRFAGWWGNEKATRFEMKPFFRPQRGAFGWQNSNVSILGLAALKASLEVFKEVSMQELRAKSELLTGYLEYLIQDIETDRISIITPSEKEARGCQLSLKVEQADKSLFQKIIDAGAVCDWREPAVIRVGPVPLYNTFSEVFRFAEILKNSL